MVLRLGVVIEGRDDSELPEQMLLSVCLNGLDMNVDSPLDADFPRL
jgi:hypothetical protein